MYIFTSTLLSQVKEVLVEGRGDMICGDYLAAQSQKDGAKLDNVPLYLLLEVLSHGEECEGRKTVQNTYLTLYCRSRLIPRHMSYNPMDHANPINPCVAAEIE